ncbi:MAG: hypothetical protein K9I94_06915 [Bacteroidales bacterium]|nr:hypothetical protein [Bacteroidales bacterium]
MDCPKCSSEHKVKDGIVAGKQRYLCKDCNYHFTVQNRGKSLELKRMVLHLYLEGLSYRSIERILSVSNVTVMNWIKSLGPEIEKLRKEPAEIQEFTKDELEEKLKSGELRSDHGFLLITLDEKLSFSGYLNQN